MQSSYKYKIIVASASLFLLSSFLQIFTQSGKKVGSLPITAGRYNAYKKQYPDNREFHENFLSNLVMQAFYKDLGLRVPKDLQIKYAQQIFDPKLTNQDLLLLAEDIVANKQIKNSVKKTAAILASKLATQYTNGLNQMRKGMHATFNASKINLKFTDADLQNHYNHNKTQFLSPRKTYGRLLTISEKLITKDKLQKLLDSGKSLEAIKHDYQGNITNTQWNNGMNINPDYSYTKHEPKSQYTVHVLSTGQILCIKIDGTDMPKLLPYKNVKSLVRKAFLQQKQTEYLSNQDNLKTLTQNLTWSTIDPISLKNADTKEEKLLFATNTNDINYYRKNNEIIFVKTTNIVNMNTDNSANAEQIRNNKTNLQNAFYQLLLNSLYESLFQEYNNDLGKLLQ